MSRQLSALQNAPLGTPVSGEPACLREAKVTVLNADGTIQARALNGRKSWESLGVPKWYAPALGDMVIVATIDGNPQRPLVIAPTVTANGTAPKILVPTFMIEHTFSVLGSVEVTQIEGTEIELGNETKKLVAVRYHIASGTSAELELKRKGTGVPGLTALVANATERKRAVPSTVPTLEAGDYFQLNIKAVSGAPKGLTFTFALQTEA